MPLSLFNPKDIYLQQTEALTEKRLREYNLGKEQVEKQNAEQLEASLGKINSYLEQPGTLVPKVSSHPLVRPRVCYLLEQRKKLILDCLETLRAEQSIKNARDLIRQRVQDADLRNRLIRELDDLDKQCIDLQKQLYESQIFRWHFARDTAGTIFIGALGVVVVSAYVLGMFMKIEIPDVFSDFMVAALGYLTASLNVKGSKDELPQNYSVNNLNSLPMKD